MRARLAGLIAVGVAASALALAASGSVEKPGCTWPQKYAVMRDAAAGTLRLETPFYAFEHDLKRGGVISRIRLRHGRAASLLVSPLTARVRLESGVVLSDVGDPAPKVELRTVGLNEVVAVDSALMDANGRDSGLRVKTTFEYRWGYVKIHREFLWPAGGLRLREVCPVATVLAPGLSDYGYRQGISEDEGAEPFSFGSNVWASFARVFPRTRRSTPASCRVR